MRLLPYLLVFAMSMPIIIWLIINNLVIRGSATSFSGADLWVLLSLGGFMVVSFFLLSTWMSRFIARTRG